MKFSYRYPRAALTVDCVVFGFDEGELKVLLIERGLEPFQGRWALPGGFVRVDETLDEAARRELEEDKASTDATDARWFPISRVPRVAFDHADILVTALTRLQGKVRYQPIGFELLPPKFTLSQLQHLYEAVLETELDKRNFRKKVLGLGLLVPLKETRMTGRHRPAQLFRFDADRYEKLKKRGFNFEL